MGLCDSQWNESFFIWRYVHRRPRLVHYTILYCWCECWYCDALSWLNRIIIKWYLTLFMLGREFSIQRRYSCKIPKRIHPWELPLQLEYSFYWLECSNSYRLVNYCLVLSYCVGVLLAYECGSLVVFKYDVDCCCGKSSNLYLFKIQSHS